MRILALETSQRIGSLATLHVDENRLRVLHQLSLPADRRSAQALIPTLQEVVSQSQWAPQEIDLICVGTGPGSFTGLRIGVTAAKTLAYATGADLVGVHTLATLAAGVPTCDGRLWAILDAQRQELFASCFTQQTAPESVTAPITSITPISNWLDQLQPGDTVVGPPLKKLAERLPAGAIAVEPPLCTPQASVVGRLGWNAQLGGAGVDPMQLTPQYFRRSAAEEKAEEKMKQS